MSTEGNPANNPSSRVYVHRRIVVRFLVALLAVLSAAAFACIALGWGTGSASVGEEDSGTPTKLADTSPFYVLLVGSDDLVGTALYTGGAQQGDDAPQADSLVLVRVDPGECVLTFVTVPANTVLEDAGGQLRDTLDGNDASQTTRTIERIAGVSIRYTFVVGFSAFEDLVTQIGGTDQDVPVPITMQDPVTAKTVDVPAGDDVELDAAQALAFLRSWEPYAADGDAHRQLNVRDVLEDLVGRVLASDDEQVRLVLGAFEKVVDSNIDDETLLSLVTRFYDEREHVTMYACTGPYLATSVDDGGETVVESQAAAWRALMSVVDAGEDPAKALPQYDFQGSDDDYVQAGDAESSGAAADSDSASASGSAGAGASSASGSSGSGAGSGDADASASVSASSGASSADGAGSAASAGASPASAGGEG